MARWKPWRKLLPIIIFSLIFGGLGLIMVLIDIIKKGPRRFFYVKQRKERPAILEDPSLGQHATVQLKSVKLHYVAHGSADKPLMLFLHGFPDCWFSWRHQIRHFASNYRTVAVDMRGYGESEKPSGASAYTTDVMIEDVRQLIQALGYERCMLVAHDWGGGVAGHFTGIYPDMVEKLILINVPYFTAFVNHLRESRDQKHKLWYMFFFQWPVLPEWWVKADDFATLAAFLTTKPKGAPRAACTAEEVEAYKYSMGQPGGLTCPINYYRALMWYRRKKPIKDITTVPSHIIWGEQDMDLDKVMAELSKQHISDLGVTYIPTAGHWSLMEEYEQVNQAMENFLSGKKSE